MKPFFAILFLFLLSSFSVLKAQADIYTVRLKDDTLFLNSNQQLITGQYLIIGKGSDEHGWYRGVGFKSFVNLPLLINHDIDLKYQYNDRSDPEQDRANDLVVSLLTPGDSLLIKKIIYKGTRHSGKYYSLNLVSKSFPFTHFTSTIDTALKYNELILP